MRRHMRFVTVISGLYRSERPLSTLLGQTSSAGSLKHRGGNFRLRKLTERA